MCASEIPADKCLRMIPMWCATKDESNGSSGKFKKRLMASTSGSSPHTSDSHLCSGGHDLFLGLTLCTPNPREGPAAAGGVSSTSVIISFATDSLLARELGDRVSSDKGFLACTPGFECGTEANKAGDNGPTGSLAVVWRVCMYDMKSSTDIPSLPLPTSSMISSTVWPSGNTSMSGPSPDSMSRSSCIEMIPFPSTSKTLNASRTRDSAISPRALSVPAKNSVYEM
mmetsp:Transcript_135006/g.252424  ORF Transcript_135006/g.252424 Transcript_135006/m.252424 type:complete len:227 (-) Transcript_135006:497-1177(-)